MKLMFSTTAMSFASEMLATESPGRYELRTAIRRNMMRGLVVSAAFHFFLLGIYFARGWMSGEEETQVVHVRLMRYSELGPPPSVTSAAPSIAVAGPSVKPSVGIPVPVPDAEISPEQTIATQQELSQVANPDVTEGLGAGEIVVQDDINIDEPGMDEFIPVEKEPMPIKVVKPDYPEVARRSGMYGTVWVRILVDKEGNAKRAVVVKSDAEIFNESAVNAAMQWKFTPAIMNKGPVAVWVAIPFRFQLHDRPS
jgi:protein TonB